VILIVAQAQPANVDTMSRELLLWITWIDVDGFADGLVGGDISLGHLAAPPSIPKTVISDTGGIFSVRSSRNQLPFRENRTLRMTQCTFFTRWGPISWKPYVDDDSVYVLHEIRDDFAETVHSPQLSVRFSRSYRFGYRFPRHELQWIAAKNGEPKSERGWTDMGVTGWLS